MARTAEMPEGLRRHVLALECPAFEATPAASGPPLARRRVAVVSTAGLGRRGDPPFAPGAVDWREIPADTPPGDVLMTHVSVNFDRTGFQEDVNVVLPLDRLRELAGEGAIGGVAPRHYSLMGASDPRGMEPHVRAMADRLRADGVDAVVLLPV